MAFPEDLTNLLTGAVEPGVFEDESDAIRHAVRESFEEHPSDRIAAAVARYELGRVTIGTAARLDDVNRFEIRGLL